MLVASERGGVSMSRTFPEACNFQVVQGSGLEFKGISGEFPFRFHCRTASSFVMGCFVVRLRYLVLEVER